VEPITETGLGAGSRDDWEAEWSDTVRAVGFSDAVFPITFRLDRK
jgi:hypothetical protein